ncbi:DUF7716 domain-containing protein [Gilliamella sp. WF3-4]|uniref:DUF7716 domain-containing protein n=1 Tax=Gilliamella sp. WF3-4 TaxID=3120255 RepID=UPI00080DDD7C|nr:hypothetical protein [Gilliamella apicola]OCG17717.1 hypothetical protein A9G47_08095 [Gilliamella apicola]
MKIIEGINGLLTIYKDRPELWYFLFTNIKIGNKKKDIREGTFYLPETDDDDDEMGELCNKYPDKYRDWLEYQTFLDIIDNKLDHHPNATKEDLLDAIIYYLENDDFLD